MTITETGRRTREQLIAEARGVFAGRTLPSKSAFAKALSAHFNTASPVHDLLAQERAEEAARRRRERRSAMAKVGRRKGFGRALPVRPRHFTTPSLPPISVVPAPVAEAVERDLPEVDLSGLPPFVPAPSEPVRKRPRSWPVVLLTLPAFVAIWGGWVDLGRLTGFGVVHPFPGIPGLDGVAVNLAITLPIGLETYAAYALSVWMSHAVPAAAKSFARWSAVGSLLLGFAGQAAYHLMIAFGVAVAPWWITLIVSGVPVAVLGMGAALRHLVHAEEVNS